MGSGVASGLMLKNANTVQARKYGVEEYERYCYNILHKHDGIEKKRAAMMTPDGEIYDPQGVSGTQDLSLQFYSGSSDDQFAAVEEIKHKDGKILRQEIKQTDGNTVSVTVKDNTFIMSFEEIERVLERRMGMVNAVIGASNRQMRKVESSNQEGDNTSPITAQDNYTRERFYNGNTDTFSLPVTGNVVTEYNDEIDRIESASMAQVAGAAGGIAGMNTQFAKRALDHMDELTVGFHGEYSASAANVLATSELEVKCEIVDDDGVVSDNDIIYRGSFPGDLWSDTDSYSEYIYAPEIPDSDVKFRIYTKTLASAIGWSATSISTATAGYGNDYVDLDKWEIQDYH